MTPTNATTALAAPPAGVETREGTSGPQIGAQRCTRKPSSTWSSCRCPGCVQRAARLSKLNRTGRIDHAAIAANRERAYARINEWVSDGWEALAIASATGLTRHTVQDIVREHAQGQRRRLSHATVRGILTAGRPTAGRVGAHGTRRRLQALTWMGWGLKELSERTGIPVMTLSGVRGRANETVAAVVANTVTEVYAGLQNTRGPAVQASAHAVRHGWPPPAAWDDEDLDNPTACPLGMGAAGPSKTDPHVIEEVAELHRVGYTDQEIADRLGYRTRAAVFMVRTRHGIHRNVA